MGILDNLDLRPEQYRKDQSTGKVSAKLTKEDIISFNGVKVPLMPNCTVELDNCTLVMGTLDLFSEEQLEELSGYIAQKVLKKMEDRIEERFAFLNDEDGD